MSHPQLQKSQGLFSNRFLPQQEQMSHPQLQKSQGQFDSSILK